MKIFSKKTDISMPKKKGFMTLEVMIGATLITLSILASMSVAQKSIMVARQALHNSQAGFLLEEGAEAVRILRDNNWTNISGLSTGTTYYPLFAGNTWTLSTTPNTVDIFTRTVTISNVNRDDTTDDISAVGTNDPRTKLVVVTVSWVEGGATLSKTLSFYIIDVFS